MRTERPAWVDDADPMTAPNDTQREALRRLLPTDRTTYVSVYGVPTPFVTKPAPRVHQSWVHHSTRDALHRRGWITIDGNGYVTLTDTGRKAAR